MTAKGKGLFRMIKNLTTVEFVIRIQKHNRIQNNNSIIFNKCGNIKPEKNQQLQQSLKQDHNQAMTDQIKQFPITVKQQITLKKGEMFIKKIPRSRAKVNCVGLILG